MITNWEVDSSWSLFLDRDGVINERIWNGYVLNYEDFTFRKGSLEAIARFSQLFSHIFIVTNQQCVAKELISVEEIRQIHCNMLSEIELNKGKITEIYTAVEFKNENPYRRKPNNTMGIEAKNQFPTVDFSKSIMVGDTDSDILFGKNLGMKTVLVLSKEVTKSTPDISIEKLSDLCAYF